MEYKWYESEELAHSTKGSAWKNHKYISKFFKNGKWVYIYKGGANNSVDINNKPTTTEYTRINRDGTVSQVKQHTTNGNSWLSKNVEVKGSDGKVTVFKTKGKIERAVEKTASKGKSFIESLSKKKKTSKSKPKKNNRIKVEYQDAKLG